MTRFALLLTLPALAFGMIHAPVHAADDYPNRPIRFVVPFPPGGGTDTVARLIAQPLADRLGQQIVVDNRGGANAIIGTDIGAKAQLNTIAMMLVAANNLPAKGVAGLVAYAKANPGKLNFGFSGNGSAGHLAVEMFNMATGIRMVHVPYKGGGPALAATIAGQLHLMAGPMISAVPHVKAGRVRGLALLTPKRVGGLPDVEAVGDSLPGFDASIWHGVLAPRGTPAAVVRRLNGEINALLRDQAIAGRMAARGAEVVGGTPQQFAALIKSDTDKYAKLLKAVGMAGSVSR